MSMIAHGPNAKILAIVYIALTFLVSWSFLWAIKAGLPLPTSVSFLILMWIPGILATALRIICREGFADAGLRAGQFRYWLLACLVPLALATTTYGAAWMLRQVHITPYLKQQSMFGPIPIQLHWWNPDAGTIGLLGQRFLVVITLGLAIGFVFGLGEEIGWRGYLLPRLVQSRVGFPILISGLVWGIWHVPLVL